MTVTRISYCGASGVPHLFQHGYCIKCRCSARFRRNATAREAAYSLRRSWLEEMELNNAILDDEERPRCSSFNPKGEQCARLQDHTGFHTGIGTDIGEGILGHRAKAIGVWG